MILTLGNQSTLTKPVHHGCHMNAGLRCDLRLAESECLVSDSKGINLFIYLIISRAAAYTQKITWLCIVCVLWVLEERSVLFKFVLASSSFLSSGLFQFRTLKRPSFSRKLKCSRKSKLRRYK